MFLKFYRNHKFSINILIISILSLLPTLFYPEGNDQTLFHFVGNSIFNGKKLYVDVVDIKPPFIYYLYSLIVQITNSSQFFIRFVDFLWQLSSILIISNLIFKISENKKISYFFSLTYGVLYTSIGFSGTGQAEGFLSLPLAISLYLHFGSKTTFAKVIFQGFVLGLFSSLKLTLLVLFIPFGLDYLFNKHYKLLLIFTLFYTISFFLPFLILFENNVFKGFKLMIKYLINYSNHIPLNENGFKIIFKNGIRNFADFTTIPIIFLFSCGLIYNFKAKTTIHKFLTFLTLIFILLLLSVFIERKFYSYHYLRFYFVVSIISSFGLSYILTLINWKILLPFTKTTLILVITSLLIFSPISRYMQGIKIMYYYLTSLNKYELFFSNKSKFEYNKPEELKLAQFVNSQMNINDYVCIIGMFNCKIHLLLKEHNYNSLTQSCFVYSNEGLVEYYNIQSKEIRKAKIILVNTSDQDFIVQPISSYNSLLNDTLNSNYIRKYFTKIDSIATYVVYKRNKLN